MRNPFPLFLLLLLLLPNPTLAAIRILIGTCHASGYLPGKVGFCTTQNDADCCQGGEFYPQYHCSPPVTESTAAIMYIGSFSKDSDGGAEAECDEKFHNDTELVVALSTGWYDGGSRCLKNIRINANGNSVLAKVVDECDSINGCTADLNYEPPCPPNVVNASPGVWEALGIQEKERTELDITWSDESTSLGNN